MAASSCTTVNHNNLQKQVKTCCGTSSSIFDIKDGVLYGFKSGTTLNDLKQNIKNNTLALPDCNEIAEGAFRDTILNDAPFGTTITIPSSTTAINDFAFYGNTATAVTWSGTPKCTTIGKSAFAKCSNLTTFTFPSTITSIKAGAFMGCSNIATFNCTALTSCPTLGNKSVFRGTKSSGSLTLTDSNAEAIWMGFVDAGLNSSWAQKNSSGGTISKPKTIPTDYLTYSTSTDNEGNATLTITGVNTSVCDITKFNKLAIPAKINNVNVTAIGASAFASKTSLTSVDFSSATNLTTINDKAFLGCTGLTSVTLSTSITTIGQYAFAPSADASPTASSNLTTVTVPTSSKLTTISQYAFNYCKKLSTFAFENTKVVTMGYRSFRNTALTSVTLPSTFTSTSSTYSTNCGQFVSCSKLTSIDLSACTKVVYLPQYFAYVCTALKTVVLPTSGLTTLPKYSFSGCTALETITISKDITTIVSTAFTNCSALTSATFGDTSNGFTVKSGSTVIDSSYMPLSPYLNAEYIRNAYTFAINPLTFTYSYLNVDNAYKSTFTLPYTTTSSSITWSSSDESIATVSSGKVTVPAGVTGSATITAKIGTSTTSTCTINAIATDTNLAYTALTSTTASVQHGSAEFTGTVTIPAVWNSRFVTTIPSYGFGNSSHVKYGTYFNLPGTLTSLGACAFYKNNRLKTVNFQEPCNFNFEGELTWYDCTLQTITFPEGLSSIPNGRHFQYRNYDDLTTIKLPKTVGYIYGNWFGDKTVWGSATLTLDLSELTQVPTLATPLGSATFTTPPLTIKVKDADMKAKFEAATNWSDTTKYTYTYDS